jgi:hypothetical protein
MKVNRPLGLLFRVYLYLRDKFNPKPIISDEERYAITIAKKLVMIPSSKLFIAPISQKYLIHNEEKKIFIVTQNRSMTIINDIYSHVAYIENDELYGSFIEEFNQEMEKRREKLESEIKTNIIYSLKNVLDTIDLP